MFPTSRLFAKDLCPEYATCRLSNCLFGSHTPSAPPAPARPALKNAASATTAKRPAPAPPAAGPSKVAKTEPTPPPKKPPTPVPAPAAAPKAQTPPTASTSKPKPPVASTSSAIFRETLVDNGPPRIAYSQATVHTPVVTRQKLLQALYDQFLLMYADLPDKRRAKILASNHAKEQEETLYQKSNKATYRNSVISALARLKKRSKPTDEDECGTLEMDAERAKRREEEEKGRLTRARLGKFVAKRETMVQYDYVVDVPEGVGGDQSNEEGNVRKCERCGQDFIVAAEGDDDIQKLHSRVAFVPTSSLKSVKSATTPKPEVIALDCELIYTTAGMALAQLTVVGHDGAVLLDEDVRVNGHPLDLNTRFSGVKEEDLGKAVLDCAGVREALGRFMDEKTIIVGHGLENDLKALRLVHPTIIDTAILFPHSRGPPFRNALRNLTRDYLGQFIQDSGAAAGHSAVVDSRAALELVRYKMKQDAR
ncbi:RNA exonuclease 1 [Pseudohyphozyma bogoriensis]|nr:RNA exonuclease 1 [Pseudohyphozyma bogoriensis]